MQQNLIPFKIKQGISTNLSLRPFLKGTIYYCTDTKDVYIDIIHPDTGEEIRQHINSIATNEIPGLMSPEDKIKLDEMTTGNTIMVHYNESKVAVAGQTEFLIDLPSFDFKNDMVEVYSGRTRLSPVLDYSITANSVVLNEGLPEGRTLDLRIIRKVFLPDGEEMFSGTQILPGSIPLDRLAEEIPDMSGVINEHANNKSNPHEVTAEQVGALSNQGGIVSGDITIANPNDYFAGVYAGVQKGLAFMEAATDESGNYAHANFGCYTGNVETWADDINYITVKPYSVEIERAVLLNRYDSNAKKTYIYKLFGEHNSNRTKLVSTETTPTTNNEIFWKYE